MNLLRWPIALIALTALTACFPPDLPGDSPETSTPVAGTPSGAPGDDDVTTGDDDVLSPTPGSSDDDITTGDDDVTTGDDDASSPTPGSSDDDATSGDDDTSSSPPQELDLDGDGYSATADCDETDSSTYPGAVEQCDGRDNECDGAIDDGLEENFQYFMDADGDGFGDEDLPVATCAESDEDVSDARGDCDDSDQLVHAGAEDVPADLVDSDCGGTDGPDPHVGLSTASLSTLEESIGQAQDGQVVWVGPGTYLEHDLTYEGKSFTLKSTHLAARTIIDADAQGRGFIFNSNEDETAVLDGFTITNGSAVSTSESGNGGGILLNSASPQIRFCILSNNTAEGTGGGMYVGGASDPVVNGCVQIRWSAFSMNGAEYGGGALAGDDVCMTLEDVDFLDNVSAFNWGGAMLVYGSNVELSGGTFEGNEAPEGGALWLEPTGSPTPANQFVTSISGTRFEGNKGTGDSSTTRYGGAIGVATDVQDLDLSLEGCDFTGNSLGDEGALENCELTDEPLSGIGGAIGVAAQSGTLTISDSTLGCNAAEKGGAVGVFAPGGAFTVLVEDSRLENNRSSGHGGAAWIASSNESGNEERLEATFRATSISGNVARGNSVGGGLYLEEADAEIDGCEVSSNVAQDGGGIYFTSAFAVLDAVSFDDNEAAGSDGDCYGPQDEGYGGGLYMIDASGPLRGCTFTGNCANYVGGAISLSRSSPEIVQSTFTGNTAVDGGGALCLQGSSPTVSLCRFLDNDASYGGAIQMYASGENDAQTPSSPILTNTRFEGNQAAAFGGALSIWDSAPQIDHAWFANNSAIGGGALYTYTSGTNPSPKETTLEYAWFISNDADNSGTGDENAFAPGGALLLAGAPVRMTQCVLQDNLATDGGGAMRVLSTTAQLENCILSDNQSPALSCEECTCSIDYSAFSSSSDTDTSFEPCLDPDQGSTNPAFGKQDFVNYSNDGDFENDNVHLSADSSLINIGDPEACDPGGGQSDPGTCDRSDPGLYGGPGADGWDLDGDGYPNYYWPGDLGDAPEGVDPCLYDSDDLDDAVGSGCTS